MNISITKQEDIPVLNSAKFKADVVFYKKLKNYFITKNQIAYFNDKSSRLDDGKKKELLNAIRKSLENFNDFLIKTGLPDISKELNMIKTFDDPSKKADFFTGVMDEKIMSLQDEYAELLAKTSKPSNRSKGKYLKKIAGFNYNRKYKNSYNSKRKIVEASQGYAFISPAIFLLSIFLVFSVGFGIYMSFFKVKAYGSGLVYHYVGLEQYKYLFHSESFRSSLKVTLTYMLMVAPAQTALSLILSSVLATKIKGKKLFTILYFLPTLTSSTALTLIFLRLFGNGGPMSSFLGQNYVNNHVLGLVAIMNIWTSIPYFLTVYNAAHADVPKSQYEAASIDGASGMKKFIKITVPYLKPVTAFVLLTSIIWTLQTFDQLYIIGKDPTLAIKSETITSTAKWIYDVAFSSLRHQDFGRAAAASIVLASIIFVVSVISNFFSKGTKN